jgi:RNA polymerase sigma factor (sigma-70 family)
MPELFALNWLYDQYTSGLLDKKKFEGLIFRAILEAPRHFNLYRWKQEDRDDFVSWLYPRISRAIDSYQDKGASFETYIGAIIRWSAKEYRSRKADHKIAEYASWMVRVPDMYTGQSRPEYTGDEPLYETEVPTEVSSEAPSEPPTEAPKEYSRLIRNPRQLLILILKCYYYVSDELLDRIAPMAGIEKEYLKEMVDKLRALRLSRDEMLHDMQERIYTQFYRCMVYERRLAAMPENSALIIKMRMRLEKARLRLAAMRKRFAGIRPDATNRQIAELIGISKGTVDCSLHALKARWNNDTDKAILD